MKTRVIEGFNWKHGFHTYTVQKWALWDDAELRGYYPEKYDWRHVDTVIDKRKAIDMAERLSNDPQTSTITVVWESQP